ncbi:MAG: UDP-glucose 4-epimerase GalE [Micrococcales bacterium]|nr:UDP-glucose 4-epimerase GalE [Micrococcales bacterium]
MAICVTGGAGYIGAHIVRLLQNGGHQVVVIDDLSTGANARVDNAELIQMDLADTGQLGPLTEVLADCSAVIHVAARKQVGESVGRPAWYYQQNVGGLANLLLAMENQGVDRLVFSSSAACYGQPDVGKVTEETPAAPISPYGATKLIGEEMVAAASKAWGLRAVSLRYFNVAGSGWDDLGDPATLNLIPIVFEQLLRHQAPVVFGNDYPTPDGTAVRDYIHVTDVATAHTASLDYLSREERPFSVFNVGSGEGASVNQVLDQIAGTTGIDLKPQIAARRPGDPAFLVADPSRINQVFGWKAQHDLAQMVASAWAAKQAAP